MSYDVGKAMEGLESSFSNLSATSPTSQLILQPFRRFTYVTVHSPTLPLFHLCHSSFSNPSVASPTSQVLHLASRLCLFFMQNYSCIPIFKFYLTCITREKPGQPGIGASSLIYIIRIEKEKLYRRSRLKPGSSALLAGALTIELFRISLL